MNIKNAKNIHFVGIGGIGTSSIAQILHKKDKIISGSDSTPSEITKSLKLSGIKVSIGHKKENVSKKHDLVVYSPAILASNEELQTAKTLKIQTLTYPEALGELTKEYTTIAIAGSHGKSTTTAMTALVLEKGGLSPTVVIGTKIRQFNNRNFKIGNSKYLVIEACEYKRSFLNFHPDILIITNIEADHLDYYKDLEDYKSAFKSFAEKVPKNGFIIINSDEPNLKEVVKDTKAKIITWNKNSKFDIKIQPKVPGKFNIHNATLAAITGQLLGVENKKIEQAIKSFKGTWRRMETKHKKGYKCKFIDDYGHHPTEISSTLEAIREQNPKAKILCIFQPHQYSRTYLLLKEFGQSFHEADKIIIPNIYKVRDTEEDIKKVSTDILVKEIKKSGKDVINGQGFKNTAEFVKKNHSKFDIIVTMGAGDINNIYKLF